MTARFSVARESGHLVIRDKEYGERAVVAILPNEGKPEAPLNIAKVCAEALNKTWEAHKGKKG